MLNMELEKLRAIIVMKRILYLPILYHINKYIELGRYLPTSYC